MVTSRLGLESSLSLPLLSQLSTIMMVTISRREKENDDGHDALDDDDRNYLHSLGYHSWGSPLGLHMAFFSSGIFSNKRPVVSFCIFQWTVMDMQ